MCVLVWGQCRKGQGCLSGYSYDAMMGQKKLEIFLVKIRKSFAKQFLEVALSHSLHCQTKTPPL